VFGGTQQLAFAGGLAGFDKLMSELGRVRCHAVEARKQNETGQSAVQGISATDGMGGIPYLPSILFTFNGAACGHSLAAFLPRKTSIY